MINIVLFCAGGMSTSLLANKMRTAAGEKGLEVTIEAYPMTQLEVVGPTADIILLGPQIRHQKGKVTEAFPDKPMAIIDMAAYGMIDGKKVIDQVCSVLGI
jgi:PTS system cellobiose-specific IIB component